jgi:hypothetical protein
MTKRFSTAHSHIHDRTAIQFLEELKPFFFGEILAYIARTGEVAAVCAPQITPACY